MGDRNQKQGKHGRGNVARASAAGLSHEAVKLLKTQDKGYIKTQAERIRREIERLESQIKLQDGMDELLGKKSQQKKEESDDEFDGFDDLDDIAFGPPAKQKSRKIVFADDKEQQADLKRKRAQVLEEDEAMDKDEDESSAKKVQKTPKQLAAERQALVEARKSKQVRKRTIASRETKLKILKKQFAELQAAEHEIDWQRGKMDNSVGGTNKNGIKWKIRERKR